MIYDSILGTIGRTPVVRINRLAPAHVQMYVKCEFFNPLSSVKDRLAIAIIEDAERRGTLEARPDRRRGDVRQHRHRARDGVRGEGLSVRRGDGRELLGRAPQDHAHARREGDPHAGRRARLRHGAQGRGAVAKKHGWFLARQFENQANPDYHRNTTGPEILRDFAGKRLDFWVTGWGTGGTLTGAGEMHQEGAAGHHASSSPSPPARRCSTGAEFKPHKIQGWTPDFVPAVLDRAVADEILPVTDDEAIQTARALAAKEGIFCGISSGGTFAAALKVAQKAPKGSVILAMLPDTGERYLTTALFEGISDASDAEP